MFALTNLINRSGTSYFLHKDTDVTNLKPKDHIVNLTARFKQHIASNSQSAISSNNQHKIVRDVEGNYHAVYESAGKIFYTYKTSGGSTWSNEVYLSRETDINGKKSNNPTIDLYYNGNASVQKWQPIVVWESRWSDNSGYFLAGKRLFGSNWGGPEVFQGDYFIQQSAYGTLSLAYPFIVYRGTDGLYITYDNNNGLNTIGNWSGPETKITGTTNLAKNPTIINDHWSGLTKTHLVWDENGSIFYGNMTFSLPSKILLIPRENCPRFRPKLPTQELI